MSNSMKQLGWLHIGENLELKYLEANEKYKLSEFINRKAFRVADTPLTYRQVNSLDSDDLLGEKRDEERTWREFSPKEMVYILIVTELKKFGLEHRKLKDLWAAFFKEPNKPRAGSKMPEPHINKYVAETAIGIVFSQVEVILVVSSDGDIAFYDPANYALHHTHLMGLPPVYIKLSLNSFVNQTLEMMKRKPFPVEWSISEEYVQSRVLDVKPKEKELLEIIRNKNYTTVKIRKKDGDVSVIHAERSNGGDITEKDILKLLKERDYQDIKITRRDGKLVNLKQEDTFKL